MILFHPSPRVGDRTSGMTRSCSASHAFLSILAVCILSLVSTTSRATPLFSTFHPMEVGRLPWFVTHADLNADGNQDLVVGNLDLNSISVLLGTGDGFFAPRHDYHVGYYPLNVAITDLDQSGSLDLIVANGISDTVSILLGNGDGSFSHGTDLIPVPEPGCIAVADFDHDGRLDLAIGGRSLRIHFGNGIGTFGAGTELMTGTEMYKWFNPALGDINQDGEPDLVVSQGAASRVAILLGQGDGTFLLQGEYPTGIGPHIPIVEDLNGDGRPDLAIPCQNSDGVSIMLQAADGTFSPPANYGSGYLTSCATSGDFNGDGKLDIAATSQSYGTVHLGNGDGTFTTHYYFNTGDLPGMVDCADFDNNGTLDLVTTIFASYSVLVLPGKGDGAFECPTELPVPEDPHALAFADVDGDGDQDLVAASDGDRVDDGQIPKVSVFLNAGDGTAAPRLEFEVGNYPHGLAIGELNGDGTPDIVTANYAGNSVSVLLGVGGGFFGLRHDFAAGDRPQSVAIGDVNGDGHQDLAVANCNSTNVSILPGNGDGTFPSKHDWEAGANPFCVVMSDLDGDGDRDLAVACKGNNSVAILLGMGDGTFASHVDYETGLEPQSIACADLNGDGIPDLATANWNSKSASVFIGNGNGTFRARQDFESGWGPISLAIADLDFDGVPDLAVSGVTTHSVSMLHGNGDGTFSERRDFGIGYNPAIPYSVAIGDWNHDGRPDIAAANDLSPGGGSAYVAVILNTADPETPTVLLDFDANGTAAGIELRWRLQNPERFRGTVLERSVRPEGPWIIVPEIRRETEGMVVVIDREVEAGTTYHYRLRSGIGADASTLGTITATARRAATPFALTSVSPSPSRDVTRITFNLAHDAKIRVSILDIAGRRVAVLADGMRTAGPHEVTWAVSHGAAPGLYFVRYEWPGKQAVRRVTVIR